VYATGLRQSHAILLIIKVKGWQCSATRFEVNNFSNLVFMILIVLARSDPWPGQEGGCLDYKTQKNAADSSFFWDVSLCRDQVEELDRFFSSVSRGSWYRYSGEPNWLELIFSDSDFHSPSNSFRASILPSWFQLPFVNGFHINQMRIIFDSGRTIQCRFLHILRGKGDYGPTFHLVNFH